MWQYSDGYNCRLCYNIPMTTENQYAKMNDTNGIQADFKRNGNKIVSDEDKATACRD